MQNLKYFTWSIGFTVFGLVGGYLLGGDSGSTLGGAALGGVIGSQFKLVSPSE